MHTKKKLMNSKILFLLGGFALLVGRAEAQSCALNVKNLQEAFATFCSGERICCTRDFYMNEGSGSETFIVTKHRQCSRENHPDKNQSPEAEEKMKQCNGGRELLETHFSCFQGDAPYRSWFLAAWPVEAYLGECLREINSQPLTAVDLKQRQERIHNVFNHARAGGYGL